MKKIRRYPKEDEYIQPVYVPDPDPDILETTGGFCPNYDKLLSKGFTVEEALVWCNMD